jgi:hypothetical protein
MPTPLEWAALGYCQQVNAKNPVIEGVEPVTPTSAVIAVSAEWTDTSDLNPGTIRMLYVKQADGSMSIMEYGLMAPASVEDLAAIADQVRQQGF